MCVEDDDYYIHSYPLDDLFDHLHSFKCACQPFYDEEEDLVIHNPWDQRDKFADGRRKPS